MTEQENIGNNDVTEASTTETQAADRTYSQKDFDDAMARTRSAVTKKVLSKYEDLGDPDELRNIVESHRKQQNELAMKRGEFEKVLQEMASKKDAEIAKRDSVIMEYKIETPLLNTAAKMKSVNPEQVKTLLRNGVKLNEDGDVEVVDSKTGSVRYDDNGKPLTVESYVTEFLQANPHFVMANPATDSTRGNIDNAPRVSGPVDLASLDLTRPDHRKIYAEAKKAGKLNSF